MTWLKRICRAGAEQRRKLLHRKSAALTPSACGWVLPPHQHCQVLAFLSPKWETCSRPSAGSCGHLRTEQADGAFLSCSLLVFPSLCQFAFQINTINTFQLNACIWVDRLRIWFTFISGWNWGKIWQWQKIHMQSNIREHTVSSHYVQTTNVWHVCFKIPLHGTDAATIILIHMELRDYPRF